MTRRSNGMTHSPTAAGERSWAKLTLLTGLIGVAAVCIALPALTANAAGMRPGAQLWVKRYNGSELGEDGASSVAVCRDGSKAFVTGFSTRAGAADYATVAYNGASGTKLWVRRYNGTGNGSDTASSVVADCRASVVIVTGASEGAVSGLDYATVAYDASTGAQRWLKRYTGPGSGVDAAAAAATSRDGSRVFVTGYSARARSGFDYATVAYDAVTGTRLWARRYNGSGNGDDFPESIATSKGGAVIVTGSSPGVGSGDDFATVAYDGATGARLWLRRYNGPGNGGDAGTSVAASADGAKVFVAGSSHGKDSGLDLTLVAYDRVTGARLWVRRYNGPGNIDDRAAAVGVSRDGKVFVTGNAFSPSSLDDYATIAYDGDTGNRLWLRRYNGESNFFDRAHSLAISPDGSRVFVTGGAQTDTTALDYTTVAYTTTTGRQLWVRRYNGTGTRDDIATSVAASRDGNVFVTGDSYGTATTLDDYATVAYRG